MPCSQAHKQTFFSYLCQNKNKTNLSHQKTKAQLFQYSLRKLNKSPYLSYS